MTTISIQDQAGMTLHYDLMKNNNLRTTQVCSQGRVTTDRHTGRQWRSDPTVSVCINKPPYAGNIKIKLKSIT